MLAHRAEAAVIDMHSEFQHHIEALHPALEALLQCEPFAFAKLPKQLPQAGVYLFSEKGLHLYAGRTNGLRKRLQQHCRDSSTHNSAPFAFRLARVQCNVLKATYKAQGSRAHLSKDETFSRAFLSAKSRVKTMEIRVVEEAVPMRQALLEMYVAVSLGTAYNNFDNH